jgi:hypothetical protein
LWSNGVSEANNFYLLDSQTAFTGSNSFDVKNGAYYFNVYDLDPNSGSLYESTAQVQFSVAYGNRHGSGSIVDLSQGSTLTTEAIYTQYKNVLLDPNDDMFTFSLSGSSLSGYDSNDIWVINFSSNAFKESLDAGVIQFTLKGALGQQTFIDDSSLNSSSLSPSGKVYNIVAGTLDGGIVKSYDNAGRGFGLFYPDVGIIILNPSAIAYEIGADVLPVYNTDTYYQNQSILFNMIKNGGSFKARSSEYISSRYYFVRVGNQEFNYSNNPSFVLSPSENPTTSGQLRFSSFVNDPQVYITTVGLYNETNDLIAVAKLSQPINKTFQEEVLIKIRLDF